MRLFDGVARLALLPDFPRAGILRDAVWDGQTMTAYEGGPAARRALAIAAAVAGVLLAVSPARAGDPSGASQSLQVIGDLGQIGDVALPGVGGIISLVGDFTAGLPLGEDPTSIEVGALSEQIIQLQTNYRLLSNEIGNLVNAQNIDALATAQAWDAGALSKISSKSDLLHAGIDEVLRPLTATPAAERDAGGFANRFHLAALGVAQAVVSEADDYIDLHYLPYGGGCVGGGAGGTDAVIGACVPNALWVVSQVVPSQVPDVDAEGLLKSYGMVDGQEMVAQYKFRPEIGLAVYFAELRAAIDAMELDLGGKDMASPLVRMTDPVRFAYFAGVYAHLFDRHIAFLTYYTAPGDPLPDGTGSADYYRYVTHTNGSLPDAYVIAMRRGESGMTPAAWETLDRMRDLLTYARAHGTLRGWTYVKPPYIVAAETPPAPTGPPSGNGPRPGPWPGGLSCVIMNNCEVRAIPPSVMVGLDAQGVAHRINLNADQLSVVPQPLWTQADAKYLMADWGDTTYVSTQSGWLYRETAGGAPTSLGSDVIYNLLSVSMFGGSDGVVYFIETNGDLYWIRDTGSGFGKPARVGNGWTGNRQVTSAGQGFIYVLTQAGDLHWYHHKAYLTGAFDWEGPSTVATGWQRYNRIVANPNGVIVAIRNDGADLYQWTGYNHLVVNGSNPPPGQPGHAELKGPFPLTGVDLNQYPTIVGVLDMTPSGVVK